MSTENKTTITSHEPTADEARLRELGYKEELSRGMGLIHNFGVSFSIISVITGGTTLFEYGLTTGGPAVMTIGWIIVSAFTGTVALGMAEIVSAVPASGGPYHWAALLAPPKYSAFWAWMVGWFNFLGQVAVTTGITFGLAQLISTAASLDGYVATPGKTIAIYIALLISHGVVNTFGVKFLKYFNTLSVTLHSLGIFSLCVATLAKAPTHQSGSFVFGKFYDGTGVDGVGWSQRASPAYVAVIGILQAQFTITGFDASAHMSEETLNSARNAPLGVIMSVGISAIFGFFFIVSMLFSIQDFDNTVASPIGQPVFQIFVDVFGTAGAKVLMALVMLCVWHCGLFSVTSNSRMYYAFARDGGIPRFFDKIEPRFSAPVRTVWLAVFLSFLLALPSLGSSVAYSAATSIATIGLYMSYGLPILLMVIYHDRFLSIRGPFNLGRFSRINGVIAAGWVMFITIVFCLPALNPVDSQTLNYTPVAVGIIFVGALSSWFSFAKSNFKGPLNELIQEGIIPSYTLDSEARTDEKPDVKTEASQKVQEVAE
ncbi:apc amino acid permease [Phaffia rhodozyma]|uniref:Apc amino acid permease n=1 Tax=Phaffia rhodozyma TaxID=264483 RepID=A0A0F7SLP0_PHARH|nr:apc amino acid permease [Phaffia rhodozyma]